MFEYTEKANEYHSMISQMSNTIVVKDLLRMLRVAESAIVDLSKESVNCRAHHKATLQYQEIQTRVEQALKNVEQHILLAKLMF